MHTLIAFATLAFASIAASAATTAHAAPGPWTLYRGASIVSPRVDYASESACVDAAKALGVSRTYSCRTITGVSVTVTADLAPTCTVPQPAAETQSVACPTGTTGSWQQTRSYSAAAYPVCWQVGAWTPSAAPSGACAPVVVTPPPAAGTNAGVPQGATETKVVTTALIGARTFNVQSEADARAVPWGSLACGDVANVYAPATYAIKIGLRAQCPASNPVVINGVSDAAGNKPVIQCAGATTMPGSTNAFSNTPAYGESLGCIVVKRGPADSYNGPKPSGIVIQGLEVRGARNGASYSTLAGGTASYSSASAIYVHVGADITIRNVTLTDSGFGLFVMAKDGMLSQAGERVTLTNSRIYGNGVSGSYLEHGVYMQSASPRVEGNYFGKVRAGSQGSSYKSRSSGELFRNNVVIASARAIDFVHAEEQEQGIAALPDYGTDYVTGNTIVSDGPEAIHYGGDNLGEQDGGALFVPTKPYRKALYFWNNTVTLDGGSAWRINVFDLSLRDTTAYVWGNTFNLSGGAAGGEFSWLQWAGQLKLGTNTVNGIQPAKARSDANGAAYSVTTGNAAPTTPYGN